MINVGELMSDPDFATTVTRRRPTGAFDNEGRYIKSGYADATIVAIVQPANDSVANLLAEGTRLDDYIMAWVGPDLMRTADGVANEADIVVYKGKSYRAMKVTDFDDNGYRRLLCLRVFT